MDGDVAKSAPVVRVERSRRPPYLAEVLSFRAEIPHRARGLAAVILVLDAALGLVALFSPDTYLDLAHGGGSPAAAAIVARTGVLWLFFACVAGFVAIAPRREALLVLAALHAMDAPADLAYLFAGHFTPLARSVLAAMPVLDLLVAAYFLRVLRRAKLRRPSD